MSIPSFKDLYRRICAGDESATIEAKRARDVGRSVLETVCAFANEPDMGGGHLLLGVAAKEDALFPDFEVVGVPDPGKIQANLASQCRSVFNLPLRPTINLETYDGKNVLVVFVAEVSAHEKPVFFKSKGITKGAYRRIGPTDQVCTDDDIAMFLRARGDKAYDEMGIDGSVLDDVDPVALSAYRKVLERVSPDSELLGYSDEDLLDALGAATRGGGARQLTATGLILFGKSLALRRFFPIAARVDYIRVEGRDWVAEPEGRYQSIEKLGPLLLTIPSLVVQVLEDIPKAFSLSEDGIHRDDMPLVPRNVIREAIVNALMHRNYRKHQAVQIVRYANRIEIINPGYSLVSEDRLGTPGSSQARNPKIASALRDVGLAETKGTGILAMREAMRRANLTLPLFESDRVGDTFAARLLVHHLMTDEDWAWLGRFKQCNLTEEEARALIVVREIGAMNNAAFRSINHVDTLKASGHLRRLRRLGLLEQKGAAATTYYVPTAMLLGDRGPGGGGNRAAKPVGKGADQSPVDNALSMGLNPADKAQSMGLGMLPGDLHASLEQLGQRAAPETMRGLIRKLCQWKSLRPSQLAAMLGGRNKTYLQTHYLRPMTKSGELRYLYPENPAHPQQAYVAAEESGPGS